MHDYLIDMLECPACHGALSWKVTTQIGTRIEEGEARCADCEAVYPLKEGIAIFLTPDLPHNDLWEQTESGLGRYLREHPEVDRRLMGAPLETLNPADRFFRSMILEESGDYTSARQVSRDAWQSLYTPEYLACYQSQLDYLVQRLSAFQGPIVDLASGRGMLVEVLASRLDNPIVMTDFSPTVLRRDRRLLEFLGLEGRVSLLAFDARRTPFREASIVALTSNLGLGNVEQPGNLLVELRRVVSGEFLAITHFYPEDDDAHRELKRERDLFYGETALERFREAGWSVTIENLCRGSAEPTPRGVVLEGFGIDELPVASTVLEWCVLVGR